MNVEATLFKDEPKLKVTALAPWFGSNRMLAPIVGKELDGCKWVGIPFAGGMAELAHIKASTMVVSDLHEHVINLAMVVADSDLRPKLIEEANGRAFHPGSLERAQGKCRQIEVEQWRSSHGNLEWAVNYFVAVWMNRSAKAGTDSELKGNLPVRWNANGGDSNTRYRSAVESLDAWGEIMRRCNFVVQDVFKFLSNVKDLDGNGLYLDPPFPGPGDDYKHKFTEHDHRGLSSLLGGFKQTRIVCRFYDHPLIRELYPESHWTWNRLKGRTQANEAAPEVLIINGESYASDH